MGEVYRLGACFKPPVRFLQGQVTGLLDGFYSVSTVYGNYLKVPSCVGQCNIGDSVLLMFLDPAHLRNPQIIDNASKVIDDSSQPDSSPVIIVTATGVWIQSEAGVGKNNLGIFYYLTETGGMNVAPSTYSQTWSYLANSLSQPILNTVTDRVWPHPLLSTDKSIFVAYSKYHIDSFDGTLLQILDPSFVDIGAPGFVRTFQLPYYYASEADRSSNTLSTFPASLFPSHSFSIADKMLPPLNLAYINDASDLANFITYLPNVYLENATDGPATYDVAQLKWTPETKVLLKQFSTLNALLSSSGGHIGASHSSVSGKRMIQCHLSADKIRIHQLDEETLAWSHLIDRTWDELMPSQAGTGYIWANLHVSQRLPAASNNAPARWGLIAEPDTDHDFTIIAQGNRGIFPISFSNRWVSTVFNVRVSETGSSDVVEVASVTTPEIGDPTILSSVIDAYDIVHADSMSGETGSDTTTFYHSYYCPTYTDPGENGFIAGYSAVDCCCAECGSPPGNPETCFDFPYYLEHHTVAIGTVTTNTEWGGVLYTPVEITFGDLVPSSPSVLSFTGLVIPLPACSPNMSGPGLSRHQWPAIVSEERITVALDPQISFSQFGRSVQAILRAKPIYLPSPAPSTLYHTATSSETGESYPAEGTELCGGLSYYSCSSVYGGCETCTSGPGEGIPGYIQTSNDLPPVTYEGVQGSDTIETYKRFHIPEISEVYETCLVFNSRDGLSRTITPISRSFSGSWYRAPSGDSETGPDHLTVSESLSLPENVWQTSLIETESNATVFVLRDDRPDFLASARPVLSVYDFAGTELATYSTLIDSSILAETHSSDARDAFDNLIVVAGQAKWRFHGQPVYTSLESYPDEPGPRMKVTYSGQKTEDGHEGETVKILLAPEGAGVGTLVDGEVLIHVSCECWEDKRAEYIDTYSGEELLFNSSFSFKTRVEYRILKWNGTSLSEVYAAHEEKICSKSAGQYDYNCLSFGNNLPRPNSLINMATDKTSINYLKQHPSNPIEWELLKKVKEPRLLEAP